MPRPKGSKNKPKLKPTITAKPTKQATAVKLELNEEEIQEENYVKEELKSIVKIKFEDRSRRCVKLGKECSEYVKEHTYFCDVCRGYEPVKD